MLKLGPTDPPLPQRGSSSRPRKHPHLWRLVTQLVPEAVYQLPAWLASRQSARLDILVPEPPMVLGECREGGGQETSPAAAVLSPPPPPARSKTPGTGDGAAGGTPGRTEASGGGTQ